MILYIENGKYIPQGSSSIEFEIENWRVIGSLQNILYLTTSDFNNYLLYNLTIEEFIRLSKINSKSAVRIPVSGDFVSISLACPKCSGTGITDWISKVVGPSSSNTYHFKLPPFNRDVKGKLYKLNTLIKVADSKIITLDSYRVQGYYSTAVIPKAHDHCEVCKGTGLFYISYMENIEELNYENLRM